MEGRVQKRIEDRVEETNARNERKKAQLAAKPTDLAANRYKDFAHDCETKKQKVADGSDSSGQPRTETIVSRSSLQ